ncbi:MAG: hypothetical protein AMXMBFR84_40740 [Candidatus Hydrogenedentota bacterium]
MPPALIYLNRLRWRAMGRRMFRGVRTVKGALFFGFGLFMFSTWLLPSLVMSFNTQPADPARIIAMTSLFMITMSVLYVGTSAGDKAIYFSPGEVEFLFPGPFTRRQLLTYKLLGILLSTAMGALVFSVFIARYTGSWGKAYVGLFSSLLFVQLFTMSALLLGQTVNERAYTAFRKRLVTLFLIVLAIGLGQVLSMRRAGGFTSVLDGVQASAVLKYLLLPLQPFGRAIASATWGEFGLWFGVTLGINGVLAAFILFLDAEYRETAVNVSQKVTNQMERARRSGMAQSARATATRSVPSLPWLLGAGPVMWRQCTNAYRNARSLMFMLVLMGTAGSVPVLVMQDGHVSSDPMRMTMFVGGILFWVTMMLSMMIRYDFRTDLDQMDWLKALPLRPAAVAMGQVLVPVMLATVLQTVVIVAMTAAGFSPMLLVIVPFTLPLNLVLFGLENFMFLLFPSRVAAFSPGDFQLFGKQMMLVMAKMAFIFVSALPAAGVWAVVLGISHSQAAGIAGAWVTFAALACAVVPGVAWAFRRFDVSVDTAG